MHAAEKKVPCLFESISYDKTLYAVKCYNLKKKEKNFMRYLTTSGSVQALRPQPERQFKSFRLSVESLEIFLTIDWTMISWDHP